MKRQSCTALLLFCFFAFGLPPLHAAKSKSKPFNNEAEADYYLTTHYNKGCYHYNLSQWYSASNEFEKVTRFFPGTEEAALASYYLGVCYFERKEYDFANEEFTNYLKASNHPDFFEDAVYYKFCVAEHFKYGKKKRFFQFRYFPKWCCGQDLALTIYDEVVIALPNHELTVRALYSKAELLMNMGEYRECIDTYQTLIRRFPKDEIVPECYLKIAEAYFQQSRYEFQNPDILALSELNARKFRDEFPKDERVAIVDQSVCRIRELYAKGLCDLGLFYERVGEPAAAAIYYQSSIEEFPTTKIAEFCRERLICLGYDLDEEEAPVTPSEDDTLFAERNDPGVEERIVLEAEGKLDADFDRAVPYQGVEGAEPVGADTGVPLLEGKFPVENVEIPLHIEERAAAPSQQESTAVYHHYSLLKKKR